MQRFYLAASGLALVGGLLLAAPAEAATHRHGWGSTTPAERVLIARSQHQLNVIKARARADGHISRWERAKIHLAQSRHDALVYRLRHN